MFQETHEAQQTDQHVDRISDDIEKALMNLQCLIVPGSSLDTCIKTTGRDNDKNSGD